MDWLSDWLSGDWFGEHSTFLERPLSTWIVAAAVFVASVLLEPVVRGFIRRRCRVEAGSGAERTWRSLIGRLNERWLRLTTFTIAIASAVFLLLPDVRVVLATRGVLIVVLALQVARLISVIIDWGLARIIAGRHDEEAARGVVGTIASLRWLVMFAAYSLILLLALQNLGVDVTALIAGLGIGGIAIALAAQNILGDLFASLTIALDKPFVAGDFIIVGAEMGTVEHVGLKTTRVRSLSGEQLVFGNADLLSSRIRNYKRMSERRVELKFGVVYSTPPERLEEIPSIVRGLVQAQPGLRFDRSHFAKFAASSLDFETIYYHPTPDFNSHMDAQQALLLGIARAFRDRGIDFAFPTQTVYLAGQEPPRSPPDHVA